MANEMNETKPGLFLFSFPVSDFCCAGGMRIQKKKKKKEKKRKIDPNDCVAVVDNGCNVEPNRQRE